MRRRSSHMAWLAAFPLVFAVACNVGTLAQGVGGSSRSHADVTGGELAEDSVPVDVLGERVRGCDVRGAALEATVDESSEFEDSVVAVVMDVTNLSTEPAIAFRAFVLRDDRRRAWNMADRTVFPGYEAVRQQAATQWPDLATDSHQIRPGDTETLLAAFKVGGDSTGFQLVGTPETMTGCRSDSPAG
ncbi:MAG TPA: hypothetical protein VFC51_18150 [Chloroflexota bacterium]|nr:hypothetical protein [Chloroflexota bacterium]